MVNILIVLLILSFTIFVHELGHFLVAKHYDMGVEEFSIGLGKIIYSRVGKDGVLYSLRILPLGGFVRFNDKKYLESDGKSQTLMSAAGSIFNIITALIFCIIFCLWQSGYGFIGSITYGFEYFGELNMAMWDALKTLVTPEVVNSLGGPITLVEQTNEILSIGTDLWIYVLIILNLNLGYINMLPIPMLDGSKTLINFTKIFTKKKFYKWEDKFNLVGAIFLYILMAILLVKDIWTYWIK